LIVGHAKSSAEPLAFVASDGGEAETSLRELGAFVSGRRAEGPDADLVAGITGLRT
jgi:hypothetical protein